LVLVNFLFHGLAMPQFYLSMNTLWPHACIYRGISGLIFKQVKSQYPKPSLYRKFRG